MTTGCSGADVAQLEVAASVLRSGAAELDRIADRVSARLRTVEWYGPSADRFAARWRSRHLARARAAAEDLRRAATDLDRNAAAQRDASKVAGVSTAAASTSGHGATAWLDAVRTEHRAIEVVVEAARPDAAPDPRLRALLDSDDVRAFVGALGRGLDVGSVVVDAALDFAEHTWLAFDDRVVHAIADGAVRFGMVEGVDVAATWMAVAATATLIPALGGALAPLAGQLAGAVAATVADLIMEAIDGGTDMVDLVADTAVEAFRDLKAAWGFVADVAGVAADMAAGAVDIVDELVAGVLGD